MSDLAASLEESKDELQVVKRKNTALIKVSVSSKPSALYIVQREEQGREVCSILDKKKFEVISA